jgi:hypothetical protein
MEPNTCFDALVEESGMSHAGLAARVNAAGRQAGLTSHYDHTSVGRWLKGQRPRGKVPEIVCDVLGHHLNRRVTLDDIGMGHPAISQAAPLSAFLNRASTLWRAGQKRSAIIDSPWISGLRAVAPVWEWENPPEDRDVARLGANRIGVNDVAMLQKARVRYESMYRQVGGIATHSRVIGFLMEHTAPLLRGSYTDSTGRDLFKATGGLVAIAGICAYDSNAQGLAQRYFHQALRLAKASSDRGFGGYIIALLVNQAVLLGDYRQAIAFAEAGLRTAGPHISAALKADLYVMQAKAFASMRSLAEAHRCMKLAESTAAQIRRENEPPETGYMQPGLLETQLAEALTSLDDIAPAITYAEESVRTPAHTRGKVQRLATLTTVYLRQRDADRAAATASEAADLAIGMESQRLHDRLGKIRAGLLRQKTATALSAAERIEDILSVPLHLTIS